MLIQPTFKTISKFSSRTGADNLPVADQCVDFVVVRTKTPQLNLFAIDDFSCVAVTPFNRNVRVCIGIYQHVEGAVAVKHGEECHGGGDLTEYCLDLRLNLLIGLLDWWF